MARKHVHSFAFFDASTPITLTTSSPSMIVGQMDYGSIAFSWANSDLIATVALEAKRGKDDDWTELDLGTAPVITGASGEHELVLTQMPFTELRVTVNVTGGTTGEIAAVLTAKSEGA